MSLQNINDTEGIKALLDSLRTSREWADAVGPSLAVGEPNTLPRDRGAPASSPDPNPSPGPRSAGPSSSNSTATTSTTTSSPITPCSISGNSSHSGTPAPSVADLLSQLRASQSLEPPTSTTSSAVRDGDRTLERRSSPGPSSPLNHTQHASPVPLPQSVSAHASKSQQDVRALSFQQALPHISRLLEDPHVAESLTKMKEEQDKLEKRLWEEREDIRRRHEEKVKVAKTKANLIGVGLSKHEAQSLSDGFQKELRKFDVERVLPAWDGLVRGQQARLEALEVPTMFVTSDAGDVQKQRRVVHVLEGILSTSDPAQ